MPLPTYDKQEDVPEAQRDDYAEHEGKWRPKVEIDLAVERKKRQQLLDEKKEAERLRKEAEKERDELKRAAEAKEKGISEEELQKIRDDEAKARKPIEDENAALKAENDKLKRYDRVRALALSKDVGVMSDRIDDAMELLEKRTVLTKEGTIAVKDKDGNVTVEKIEDFLKTTFRKEKPWLYVGPESSGSGAEGSQGGGGQGSYDPVAAGKKAAEEQKKGNAEKTLAFK